jgi:hypothetical protein
MINKILNLFIPIQLFKDTYEILKPSLCRHEMRYWDMKWFVDTEDYSDPNYVRFNGKVWRNTFCECQKCGIQKRMSMKVGEWGKWKNHPFDKTDNGVIEVEILQYGAETKRQKRDRILKELGI